MSAIDHVKSRRDRLRPARRARDAVSTKLGGLTVWAENDDILKTGIRELQGSIEQTATMHLTIVRSVLKKLVVQSLESSDLDDKVFSGVLGATLRSGRLDSVVCSSTNDRPYRVLMHTSQSARWLTSRETALEMLRTKGTVRVRDLEGRIFGARAYNTYSSAMHVLARLSYLGVVRLEGDTAYCAIKDFA
ncbi:MAG: hypothetical protein M3N91_17550 [Pseudomonadota bacterium]|nr:hypothetical protein [Pseudomonadota bacterium]